MAVILIITECLTFPPLPSRRKSKACRDPFRRSARHGNDSPLKELKGDEAEK